MNKNKLEKKIESLLMNLAHCELELESARKVLRAIAKNKEIIDYYAPNRHFPVKKGDLDARVEKIRKRR